MNILLLSRYTRLGASSRLRTMQYIPYLSSKGFNIQVISFFDDTYLKHLYSNNRSNFSIFKYLFKRLRDIKKIQNIDLIWIEKEAMPWVPWFFENALLPKNIPIITDYDDAIFHRYNQHQSPIVRHFLGNKIGALMKRSALVIAGNSYLADFAKRSNAKNIQIVPTVVNLDFYNIRKKQCAKENKLVVGWIGTPQTWNELASPVYSALEGLIENENATFCAVGASMTHFKRGALEMLPWSEEEEVSLIQGMDIGVMPLPDNSWTKGKCGYKLIQYMACGLPVVASSIGVNCEIIEDGVDGFLVRDVQEWRDAIKLLLHNIKLRDEMGAAGRKKVEKNYSLQAWRPRIAHMIHQHSG